MAHGGKRSYRVYKFLTPEPSTVAVNHVLAREGLTLVAGEPGMQLT